MKLTTKGDRLATILTIEGEKVPSSSPGLKLQGKGEGTSYPMRLI